MSAVYGVGDGGLSRRELIVNAARAAIEEHGPDALTEQIAERAGLARPNVYRHFSSKDDLDLAVARSAHEELRGAVLTRLDRGGTALEVIRAPIEVHVIWADRHPNLYRFIVSRGYQERAQRRRADRRGFTTDLVAAGARYFPHFADDPDAASGLVVALAGFVDASILNWLSRRTERRKKLIDRLSAQAWLLVDHHLRQFGVCLDPAVSLPKTAQPTG